MPSQASKRDFRDERVSFAKVQDLPDFPTSRQLDMALRVRHMSMTLLLSRFTSKKAAVNNRS